MTKNVLHQKVSFESYRSQRSHVFDIQVRLQQTTKKEYRDILYTQIVS